MANTEFLAQFMGAFAIIMGMSMLLRRGLVVEAFDEVFSSRAITYVIGLLEVIGGTLIVLSHQVWQGALASMVTVLGWFILIEGVFYLFASAKSLKRLSSLFHNKKVYYSWAVIYVAIGVYLMYASFGAEFPVF